MDKDEKTDAAPQQTEDPEWDRWEEDEPESGGRRLGRNIPGWLPIAGIAVVVVLAGLWWGLTSGSPPAKTTATRPKVVATLPAGTATKAVNMPTVKQSSGGTPAATVTVPPVLPGGLIAIGKRVRVAGSGVEGISLRYGGGLNYARVSTLMDDTILTVLDKPASLEDAYPVQQDGFIWWRVQTGDGTIGWVAENWLRLEP